jgi:hypothetical protein
MATAREKKMATGTKATAKPVESGAPQDVEKQGDQAKPENVVDVAALQAEMDELRLERAQLAEDARAALEQGQQMLAAAMALVQQGASSGPNAKQDVEPGKDDVRRNIADPDFEPVTFRSKGAMLRVVRVPATRWTTLNGEAQHAGGISYDFGPGRGDFIALNADVADWLRTRPAFNLEFWEVGNEPHSAPDPSVILDKVLTALMELDLDKLDELLLLEQASHKRKVVLDQIQAAKRKVAGA